MQGIGKLSLGLQGQRLEASPNPSKDVMSASDEFRQMVGALRSGVLQPSPETGQDGRDPKAKDADGATPEAHAAPRQVAEAGIETGPMPVVTAMSEPSQTAPEHPVSVKAELGQPVEIGTGPGDSPQRGTPLAHGLVPVPGANLPTAEGGEGAGSAVSQVQGGARPAQAISIGAPAFVLASAASTSAPLDLAPAAAVPQIGVPATAPPPELGARGSAVAAWVVEPAAQGTTRDLAALATGPASAPRHMPPTPSVTVRHEAFFNQKRILLPEQRQTLVEIVEKQLGLLFKPEAVAVEKGKGATTQTGLPISVAIGDAPVLSRGSAGPAVIPVAVPPSHSEPVRSSAAIDFLVGPDGGDDNFSLVLRHKDLGHISLTFKALEAGLTVHLATDRPEVLELIKRNISFLSSALKEGGLGDLAFSFDNGGAKNGRKPDQQRKASMFEDFGIYDAADARTTAQQPARVSGYAIDFRF